MSSWLKTNQHNTHNSCPASSKFPLLVTHFANISQTLTPCLRHAIVPQAKRLMLCSYRMLFLPLMVTVVFTTRNILLLLRMFLILRNVHQLNVEARNMVFEMRRKTTCVSMLSSMLVTELYCTLSYAFYPLSYSTLWSISLMAGAASWYYL